MGSCSGDGVEVVGACPSGTALSSPSAIEPASQSRPSGLQSAGAALVAAAGADYDYVGFHLYRAQGDSFYGVDLHRGQWVQTGVGPTLAEAFDAASANKPLYVQKEDA